VPTFSAGTLWSKLISAIDSVETDIYGFPVIVGGFTGSSTYLNAANDPADNYGLAAQNLMFSSENALRNINGIQYLTTSIAEFFTAEKNIDGLGLGIEGDDFVIEKLSYFFDAATEILDLEDKVQGFEIEPMSQQMFNNIKCGYKSPSTNNLFGVDEYILPTEYVTPSNKTPKVQDMAINSYIAGQYEQEKMRAQQPETSTASPSAANACVLLVKSDDSTPLRTVYSPSGAAVSVSVFDLLLFPDAQSTDPSAATDPYINGMYYPDTARNIPLMPALNIYRNAPLLLSMLDQMDDELLTYRKQYQMNYANPLAPLEQPGINVKVFGAAANATADIPISYLTGKLFRPYLFKIKVAYPQSMYTVINSNPYGYISFLWSGEVYKGFISSVTQMGGNGEPTLMELIAHPDTTDAQLRSN
jgi:hypothetical protein